MKCLFMITIMILNTQENRAPAMKIARSVCKYSKKYDVDPVLVVALIKHESDFSRRCYNSTGDYGLMQIHAEDRYGARWINGTRCDLYETNCNVAKGAKFLAIWKKACKKHKHKSHWLRHYNWNSKKHHLTVLWLRKAYKQAYAGKEELYKVIRSKYRRMKIAKLNKLLDTNENILHHNHNTNDNLGSVSYNNQ